MGTELKQDQVSKSEFKARALELLRRVESSGEPLIVTDRGTPVLEVRRHVSRERPALEILKGSVIQYDDPTEPAADQDWEAPR